MSQTELDVMLAERAVERVLLAYARAVDRLDLPSIESCYWPDAHDWHGSFRGPLAEFMVWVDGRLREFESTVHFLGNTLVEVQLDGATALAESYCTAYHRIAGDALTGPRDLFIGLRYVDRFEQRSGEWRIAGRVVTYEWKRELPGQNLALSPTHIWGERGGGDPLRWILDVDLTDAS